MRKIHLIVFGFMLCAALVATAADTYTMADGTTLTGDIVSFNDVGIIFRTSDDKYTERTPWTKFSQDSLKQLSQNPKIQPLVEPFIEVPESERPKKAEIKVNDVTRLQMPEKKSLVGALFSSSIGLLIIALAYGANIYAGFEVAIFRARPLGLVMGVSAVLPVVGPIIFLSMPTVMKPVEQPAEDVVAAQEQTFTVPGMPQEEIQVTEASWQTPGAASNLPPTQVFQRGKFTFNRRFMETKFAGFFSVTRRDEDKDIIFTAKTMRGQFVVQRIASISQDNVNFEIAKGDASYEESVPFVEIQEIQLKHKDA